MPPNDTPKSDGQGPLDGAADDEEEFSLEDLGAAYAKAAAEHDPGSFAVAESAADPAEPDQAADVAAQVDIATLHQEDPNDRVTPEQIVEAVLFVGHPKNQPCTLERLASLMRDVTPAECREIIDALNQSYRDSDQALRIVSDEHGFKMSIAPEIETVRRSFLGKVREARLSQVMIEVLSLVAYQPGITLQKVNDQRGRECGPTLSQLVRRRLLELRREQESENSKKRVSCYYPTERFLNLFGLESLADLPQVDESFSG